MYPLCSLDSPPTAAALQHLPALTADRRLVTLKRADPQVDEPLHKRHKAQAEECQAEKREAEE